jgi:short-subunit dehydrogenase
MSTTESRRSALVTGATSGIGAALARRLAASGHDLVLVARDAERLARTAEDVSASFGVDARGHSADLSTVDGCDSVAELLRTTGFDLLVNNAGATLNKSFLRTTVADEERLLQLNVHSVMRLTHAALPGMVERRGGSVINISSASAFAPVMAGSTYPASKSWVMNFSQSIALAVKPFGVRVMALCPGYTRTEFHASAGVDMSKTPSYMWLDADAVARDGLRDLARGKLVSVPDWRYKVAVFGMRHAPAGLLRRAAGDTRGKIK